jgi:hypothetical protein
MFRNYKKNMSNFVRMCISKSGYVFLIKFTVILGFLFSSTVFSQALTIQSVNYSDSTVWYIQNNTADTLYPTSATCKVHHMLPNLAVTPINTGPGFFSNSEKITIKGTKYTWKYATSFGCSVSDTLFPGNAIPVAISVNYNNAVRDTIMPAGITLFTNKPEIKEWPVVPNGASCDYKRIFITSRWKEQGVHFYSSVYPSLNPNVCQSISSGSAVANAFNPYSLKQTTSRVVPKCPGGRQWTSFGFPKDSVLYYSFRTLDSKHLDSIIEGLDSGDYFAYASWPSITAADLYAQSAIWAKVGLDVSEIPSGTGGQFCFLGRKGLPKGKALYKYEQILGSTVSVTADYIMIRDQGLNELKPYPACFEDVAVVHQPYVPEVIKNSVKNIDNDVAFYPNPSHGREWFVRCSISDARYQIFDCKGKQLLKGDLKQNTELLIEHGNLPSGQYKLLITTTSGLTMVKSALKL